MGAARHNSAIAVVGDVHGHLQLALCVLARWQSEMKISFDAVFLCGDIGSFTCDEQLDSTTRRHGKANPCELEFLNQWAADPQPPWIDYIFRSESDGGLGLDCPVIMVHGNHEGFKHLAALVPDEPYPGTPVAPDALPGVDVGGHISLLLSGWRVKLESGLIVGGVGGIEEGQRYADYHRVAYIDEAAVLHLLENDPFDVLITHQGPSGLQGDHGSDILQNLLDHGIAKLWFHGHSIPHPEIVDAGPNNRTQIIPLGDIAFPGRGPKAEDPGEDGWALVTSEKGNVTAERVAPGFLRDFRSKKWTRTPQGLLIAPNLWQTLPRNLQVEALRG